VQVEFISYLSNKAEKRQNAIVTQSHQELEKLQRQRQNMQDKHEEKKNGKTSVYVSVQ